MVASFVYADDQPPKSSSKNGNFSKKSFSNKNAWSTEGKGKLLPPDPGAGGTGTEMGTPIPNGLSLLLIGSFIFFSVRVLNENKKKKLT